MSHPESENGLKKVNSHLNEYTEYTYSSYNQYGEHVYGSYREEVYSVYSPGLSALDENHYQ